MSPRLALRLSWVCSALLLTAACADKGDDDDDDPVVLTPPAGLEDALGDVAGFDDGLDAWGPSMWCSEGTWDVHVTVDGWEGQAADAVLLASWDLSTDTFAEVGWLAFVSEEVDGEGTRSSVWEGTFTEAEAGVSCDAPGATSFLTLPLRGALMGTPGGPGGMGASSGCGYASFGGVEAEAYADPEAGVTAVLWRETDLFAASTETGALEQTGVEDWGDVWTGSLPDLGSTGDHRLEATLGFWYEADGEVVGTCVL